MKLFVLLHIVTSTNPTALLIYPLYSSDGTLLGFLQDVSSVQTASFPPQNNYQTVSATQLIPPFDSNFSYPSENFHFIKQDNVQPPMPQIQHFTTQTKNKDHFVSSDSFLNPNECIKYQITSNSPNKCMPREERVQEYKDLSGTKSSYMNRSCPPRLIQIDNMQQNDPATLKSPTLNENNVKQNSTEQETIEYSSSKKLILGFPVILLQKNDFTKDIIVEYHAIFNDAELTFYEKEKIMFPKCCGIDGSNKLCQTIQLSSLKLKYLGSNIYKEMDINEFLAKLKQIIIRKTPLLLEYWCDQEFSKALEWVFNLLEYRLLSVTFFFANFIYRLNNKRVYTGLRPDGKTAYNVFEHTKSAYDMNLSKSLMISCKYWKDVTNECVTMRDFIYVSFDNIVRGVFTVGFDSVFSKNFLGGFKNNIYEAVEQLIKQDI
ncbi:hypothetical protein H312_01609 [Anncaliia algerae PRA339]|uniref:Uncharacterized protein n=1 Tax=Anncaliia algerae PRA339 TaxID=1288291 RepID=A0A059F1S3_9MICR|nr:hypothetical protein H312_01609 [Anncaliia algerae PRA339]